MFINLPPITPSMKESFFSFSGRVEGRPTTPLSTFVVKGSSPSSWPTGAGQGFRPTQLAGVTLSSSAKS